MRETCTSGSVRGEGGNLLTYSALPSLCSHTDSGGLGTSINNDADPDFLYVAPSKTACAAFSKESRMKFASAAKIHRKSGGAP